MQPVEIPDEVVTKVALALADKVGEWPADSSLPYDSRVGVGRTFQELSRAALEAALPYLAPAAPRVLVCSNCEGCDVCCGDITDIAPAPAVPQPVDREALAKRIEQSIDDSDLMGCGCCGGLYDYDKYESRSEALAAQVAAVLAGEQEQVESPE